MTLFTIALFAHFLGLIALFGGFILQTRAGSRLRASATYDQARTWLGLGALAPPMLRSGSTMLLITGGYMTWVRYPHMPPWIVVALSGVIALSIVGAVTGGRHAGRIAPRIMEGGDGPLPADLAADIRTPREWITAVTINGGAIGILWLMATTPHGWPAALAGVAVFLVAGAIGGAVSARK